MSRVPTRLTQLSCVALVVAGLTPWTLLLAGLHVRAIDSTIPLTMSIAVWMVLLVPLWVLWFAVTAWDKRNETALPAIIMAAPVALVTALFLVIPAGSALP